MDDREAAKIRVGKSALRILEQYGVERTVNMYRGGFQALAVCLLASIGYTETRRLFNEVMDQYPEHVPLKLVVDNSGGDAA
jgi:hypothetical protein